MKKVLFILALLLVLISGAVYAADGDLFSVTNSSGNEFRITSAGRLVGNKIYSSSVATLTSVAASDSGKTYVLAANATVALPSAEAGLVYKFVIDGPRAVYLDPQSDDVIVYASTGVPLSAGQKLISPTTPASGDSVEVFAVDGTYWHVGEMKGTWRNGT